MPHQCVHCSRIYPDASKELLEGCSCGSHFFFYVKKENLDKLEQDTVKMALNDNQKKKIEKDVREIMGIEKEDTPVILDLESIKINGPGKFELDIVKLFNDKNPVIYKLEEGKYIVDLASTFNAHKNEKNSKKGN
jgi:predicted  nucleic acid-binding Zn-ribbon protein